MTKQVRCIDAGGNLCDVVMADTSGSYRWAAQGARILCDIAQGLACLHARDFVHGSALFGYSSPDVIDVDHDQLDEYIYLESQEIVANFKCFPPLGMTGLP